MHADVSSANIVGFQMVSVCNGFSAFTPTFKKVGSSELIDIKSIQPCDPNGNVLSKKDGTVYLKVFDDKGNYAANSIDWDGKSGRGWSINGVAIEDGQVMIGNGSGIMVYNSLKVDADGNESTARTGTTSSAAMFRVSGEVDLACINQVINGFSFTGNSTPVAIDLYDIKPTDPNGNVLSKKDGTVYIKIFDDKGNYAANSIDWDGKSGRGWSINGVSIAAKEYILQPGVSVMIYNSLKVDADGNESTARTGTVSSPAYLQLPKPIAD